MRIILLGDKSEASRWIPLGKRIAKHMLENEGGTRTLSPIEGVLIRAQRAGGSARVWIEAGGLLVFTAGFESNELTVKVAADYNRAFTPRLKPVNEPFMPPWGANSSVGSFVNLGGEALFAAGDSTGSVIYKVNISGNIRIKPILAAPDWAPDTQHISYVGEFPDGKRLVAGGFLNGDSRLPMLSTYNADGVLLQHTQMPLPPGFTYGVSPTGMILPAVGVSGGTAILLVRIGTGSSIQYRRLYSTDGGTTWSYLPAGELENSMASSTFPNTYKISPLPNGKAIAIGVRHLAPSGVVAFLSDDRGITFSAPIRIKGVSYDELLFHAISLGGTSIGLLTLTEPFTETSDGLVSDVRLSRSDDGGLTWTQLSPIAPGIATLTVPTKPPFVNTRTVGNVVLLAPGVLGIGVFSFADLNHHLYVSHDFGESWTKGQQLGAAPTSRDFFYALRIGNTATPLPANPAIPDLYENAA